MVLESSARALATDPEETGALTTVTGESQEHSSETILAMAAKVLTRAHIIFMVG